MAEPVVVYITLVSPLELFIVTFETHYYTTSQGKKKVEHVIKNLINIRHPKLLSVYALKLVFPPNALPVLMVLMGQAPPLTLQDVLEDSEPMCEDRASVRCCVFYSDPSD
jgi:translation initiation factor 2-alpha kinase 4